MYCNQQQILNLSLTRVPFELMEAERKPVEYRKGSEWIRARVAGKKITHIKFTNGYGNHLPFFVAEYNGYVIAKRAFRKVYDNGLVVDVEPGDYLLILGRIVERGNLEKLKQNVRPKTAKSFTRMFRAKVW